MQTKRPWLWPVIGLFAFTGFVVPAVASCGGGGGMNAQEAGLLADFLILAVKPEGDDRDYKLVEIGDTKIDAGLLGVVINTLPLDFLGLGSSERTYDEAAELTQCRSACRANAQCRDFSYVHPSASQPVGVCHLKRVAESASYGVMTPVSGPGEGTVIERPIREPAPTASPRTTADKIVFDDSEKSGRVSYAADDARTTPLTLKFLAPISNLKVFIRAADANGQRTWANVEALGTKGKRVAQTGTWISAGGELNFGHGVAIATEGDRIAVVKISARDGAALLVDGIEFARTLIAPPVHETPETTVPVTPPPREAIPTPPRLPPIIAEPMSVPPRVVAEAPTAPPRVITTPPPPLATLPPLPEPTVAQPEPPPVEPIATEPTPPPSIAPPVVAPPVITPERPRRGLPIWAVVAAIALVLGGAGTYWHSHRRRMLKRLTTRLVSNGLDRQTVAVQASERPDIGLRFVVRSSAAIGAPGTHIELVPAGAYA